MPCMHNGNTASATRDPRTDRSVRMDTLKAPLPKQAFDLQNRGERKPLTRMLQFLDGDLQSADALPKCAPARNGYHTLDPFRIHVPKQIAKQNPRSPDIAVADHV